MKEIKSIDTFYSGVLFRSRLEARWAVFLNCLGISWVYESEGYDLPAKGKRVKSVKYLPDFKIPSQKIFPKELYLEIKPAVKINEEVKDKVFRFVEHLDTRMTILSDVPYPDDIECYSYNDERGNSQHLCELEIECFYPNGSDLGYCFCQCPFCEKFGFEFNGRSARIGCGCDHSKVANGDKTYNNSTIALVSAYAMARSERF